MPPTLALCLTIAFIVFLFWRDCKEKPNVTGALWITQLWILIIGSRFVSEWLNLGGATLTRASALEDGSPIDRLVFFALILAGLSVLVRRQFQLSEFLAKNTWLSIYFLYCAAAILWSDFPLVSFKRWIKVLGHPIMVLVLFTEPDPKEAITRLMKRCAYVLIPLSILFIKYYPELGRGFSMWTGEAYNTGVTADKNALGYVCMVLGAFFFWNVLKTMRNEKGKPRRDELILSFGFLAMIWWLMSMANSATSLGSLLVCASMMLFIGLKNVKRFIGIYVLLGISILIGAELVFGVRDNLVRLLGRDSTLTGRTELWEEVLNVGINPILGAGFESFWLGERLELLWAKYWWRPNQAHNGYLETYLNLGLAGVFISASLLIATFRKARRQLLTEFEFGRLRIGFLSMIVIYNYTESTFVALHFVLLAFYIIAIDYSQPFSPGDVPDGVRAGATERIGHVGGSLGRVLT